MKNPLVSIIVPIFNVELYLKECLESLINQSYKNLDIILIDDGSSDKSLEIALEYALLDERIFIVSKKNGGLSSARNFGLEFIKGTKLRAFFESKNLVKKIQTFTKTHNFKAKFKFIKDSEIKAHFTQISGNFIKSDLIKISDFLVQKIPKNAIIHFVDSDDFLRLDCIEICVKKMLENKAEIIFYDYEQFLENAFKKVALKIKQKPYNSGLDLLCENKFYDFHFAWNGLFCGEILNRYALRFSEGIFHEDHDFGVLLFALAKYCLHLKDALYIYRSRSGSIMNSQKEAKFPTQMPNFLAPLKPYFSDYKALREYFKAYSFVFIGLRIWQFYQSDKNFAKSYQKFFIKSALKCIKIFKISLENDPLNIKKLLAKFDFPKGVILLDFLSDIHRQPKKLKYAQNLKFLLSKDKK